MKALGPCQAQGRVDDTHQVCHGDVFLLDAYAVGVLPVQCLTGLYLREIEFRLERLEILNHGRPARYLGLLMRSRARVCANSICRSLSKCAASTPRVRSSRASRLSGDSVTCASACSAGPRSARNASIAACAAAADAPASASSRALIAMAFAVMRASYVSARGSCASRVSSNVRRAVSSRLTPSGAAKAGGTAARAFCAVAMSSLSVSRP